jgi:hypothetical protein
MNIGGATQQPDSPSTVRNGGGMSKEQAKKEVRKVVGGKQLVGPAVNLENVI